MISVLMIEDNPGDARLVQEALAESGARDFSLLHEQRLAAGVARLAELRIDLVLLDLSLPDGHRLDTLAKLREHEPNVPVVVLTGLVDEAMAIQAVQAGAQDYLVKGQFDGHSLIRAMRYALERHRLQETVRNLSLTDELTGLLNRRGLMTLAEQHLKLARRNKKQTVLVFADLDGLKAINDTFGHLEGDRALVETAGVLRRTCRESDIIARVGGDEFVVLTSDCSGEGVDPLVERFQEALRKRNAKKDNPYRLSCSTGVVRFDTARSLSLEEAMDRADKILYRNKQKKRFITVAAG